MPITEVARRASLRDDAALRSAIAKVVVASAWLGVALASFLFVRRLVGSISAPLPLPLLAATAITLTLWSTCAGVFASRFMGSVNLGGGISVKRGVIVAVPTMVLLLVAVAFSFRTIEWLIWLPAIALSAYAPRWMRGEPVDTRSAAAGTNVSVTVQEEPVLQQVTRCRTSEGAEAVHATLIAEFPGGERNATVYLAFCPPFELVPEVEASAIAGPDAEVKIAQLLHNGVQIDVRLNESSGIPARVEVELAAEARSENSKPAVSLAGSRCPSPGAPV